MIRNYQTSKVIGLYFSIVLLTTIFVGLPIIFSQDEKIRSAGGVSIEAGAAFLLEALIFFCAFLRRIYLMRPVRVDDKGVAAFWGRRMCKFIAWSEILKIEKSYLMIPFDRPREVISIISAKSIIQFDEWLYNYRDFLEELSNKTDALDIPTFERRGNVIIRSRML